MIPENLGWALVGATAMACVCALTMLVKMIAIAIKENREEIED